MSKRSAGCGIVGIIWGLLTFGLILIFKGKKKD